jgi:hypothetical protein
VEKIMTEKNIMGGGKSHSRKNIMGGGKYDGMKKTFGGGKYYGEKKSCCGWVYSHPTPEGNFNAPPCRFIFEYY